MTKAVDDSFNSITVDGDTSTNDMVLLLANGVAGNETIQPGSREADVFTQAVADVLLDLAKMIVRDGEGATKLVHIELCGANSDVEAKIAAPQCGDLQFGEDGFFW